MFLQKTLIGGVFDAEQQLSFAKKLSLLIFSRNFETIRVKVPVLRLEEVEGVFFSRERVSLRDLFRKQTLPVLV